MEKNSDKKAKFIKKFKELQAKWGHGKFSTNALNEAQSFLDMTLEGLHPNIREEEHLYCYSINEFHDYDITTYGSQVGFIACCLGLLKKLRDGNDLNADEARSLAFAYAVYWNLGNDLLLNNIVERRLNDVGEPKSEGFGEGATKLGWECWIEMHKAWDDNFRWCYHAYRSMANPLRPPFMKRLKAKLDKLVQ